MTHLTAQLCTLRDRLMQALASDGKIPQHVLVNTTVRDIFFRYNPQDDSLLPAAFYMNHDLYLIPPHLQPMLGQWLMLREDLNGYVFCALEQAKFLVHQPVQL